MHPQDPEVDRIVFIHRSIKTRIETYRKGLNGARVLWFLYIDPLKQGLKPLDKGYGSKQNMSFYT